MKVTEDADFNHVHNLLKTPFLYKKVNNMNNGLSRNLKIQKMPQTKPLYETRILVLSISPCQEKLSIEIKMEEWVINLN